MALKIHVSQGKRITSPTAIRVIEAGEEVRKAAIDRFVQGWNVGPKRPSQPLSGGGPKGRS